MSYNNDSVVRALNGAYHYRQSRGQLTATVTTKFENDGTSLGVEKLLIALTNAGHTDHADAVAALNELLT